MGARKDPFINIVRGSVIIDSEKKEVTLLLDVVNATIESDVLGEVEGATLTLIGPERTILGDVQRHRLAVKGDYVRCAGIESVITHTIRGNDAERRKWIDLVRV